MSSQLQLPMLQLYRHILKAAQHFPSRKKGGIIREIKLEFRANRVSIICIMPVPIASMLEALFTRHARAHWTMLG